MKSYLPALLLLLALVPLSFAADVSACGTISTGGTHTLTTSLFTTGDCITINANDVVFSCAGYSITGDRGISDIAVRLSTVNNVTVQDCLLQGFGGAVSITANNSFVVNNTIYNNSGVNIALMSSNDRLLNNNISNNTIYDGTGNFGIQSAPIGTGDAVNTTIERNIIRNMTTGQAIRFGGSNSSIKFNTIYNLSGSALNLEIMSGMNASNNTIYNIVATAVQFSGGANNTEIYGNHIFNISGGSVILMGARDSMITNNRIENSTQDAIVVFSNANYSIKGNLVRNTARGLFVISENTSAVGNTIYNVTNDIGIFVNVSNNNISGNTIYGLAYGIEVDAGNNNTINSNTISNTTTADGIFLNGTNSTANSNTISNVSLGGSGIFVNNNGNTVFSNTIYNASAGIRTGGTRHIVDSNTIYNVSTGIFLYGTEHLIRSNHLDNTSEPNTDENPYAIEIGDIPDQLNNITNNTIRGWNVGIDINAPNINITGNTIHSSSDIGIFVSEENITIASNTIYNSTNVGIYLLGINGLGLTPATNTKITGNIIFNHTTSGSSFISDVELPITSSSAIDMETADAFNNISSNTIYGNLYGVVLNTVNNTVSSSNNFSNNTYGGVYVNNSFGNNFSNNVFGVSGATVNWLFVNSGALNANFSNTTFETGLGRVRFIATFTGNNSAATNLTTLDLNITNNRVRINATKLPFLNSSAEITLANISFIDPKPQVDFGDTGSYTDCPAGVCNEMSYAGGIFIYNVTHFTSYSSAEAASTLGSCGTISTAGTHALTQSITGAPIDAGPLSGNACIKIVTSDVTLDLAGYSTTNNESGTTYGILINGSVSNITIRSAGNISNYTNGIYIYQAENVTVTASNLSNNSVGIYTDTSNRTNISGSGLWNMENYSIYSTASSNGNISNNTIRDGSDNAIRLENSSAYTIERNLIHNVSVIGIYLRLNSSLNTLTNNTIYNISDNAIQLQDDAHQNTIQNNTLYNVSSGAGVLVSRNSNSNAIRFNIAHNNVYGLTVEGNENNSVVSNELYDNTLIGIILSVEGDANFTNISSNTLYRNAIGIYASNSKNNFILSNTIYNNSAHGIELTGTANGYNISSNTIFNNSHIGILLDPSSQNNRIFSNTIYNHTQGLASAIFLNSTNAVNYIYDSFLYNNTFGIYLNHSNQTNISGINFTSNIYAIFIANASANNFTNTVIELTDDPQNWYFATASTSNNNFTNTTFLHPYGNLRFPLTFMVNTSQSTNLTLSILSPDTNTITLNTTLYPYLNTTAILTFNDIGFLDPKPQVDFEDDGTYTDCPAGVCNEMSYSGGVFIYNVTHFTTYSSAEAGTPPTNITACGIVASSGSYTLNTSLNSNGTCIRIQADNVTFSCAGNTITDNRNQSGYGIQTESGSRYNVTIRDCFIQSFGTAIFLGGVNNSFILNNTLYNNSDMGINVGSASRDTNISNNTIIHNDNFGMILALGGDVAGINNITVSNNIIFNLSNTSGEGLRFAGTNSTISFNTLYNTSGIGINVRTLGGNTVNNNTVYNVSDTAIQVQSGANSSIVQGNLVYNARTGISVSSQDNWVDSNTVVNSTIGQTTFGILSLAVNNNITSNTVRKIGATGTPFYGIATNAQNNNISSNTVSDVYYGIALAGDANSTLLYRNTVYNISSNGILVSAHRNTVDSNTVYNISDSGIYVNTTENIIRNNRIDNSTDLSTLEGFGIEFTDDSIQPDRNNATNNTIRGWNTGIFVIGSSSNITGNTIYSNNDYGILLGGENNTIRGNTIYNNTNGGIYLFGINSADIVPTKNSSISGNTIFNHTSSGASLIGSLGNPYVSGAGIDAALGDVFQNISLNYIYNNTYGTVVNSLNQSTFNLNNLTGNTYGVFINNSFNNNFTNNILNPLSGNFWLFVNASTSNINFTNTTFLTSSGSLRFPLTFMANASASTNLTITDLNITLNRTRLNATLYPFLNTTAIITLNTITFTDPKPQVDFGDTGSYTDCPAGVCNEMSYSGGIFIYNVTHFTSYSSAENATGDISACGTISSGGTYTLTTSLFTTGDCITINANDTVFSCAGYTITGDRGNTDKGVIIGSNRFNVTVRDCFIQSFGTGIDLNGGVNSSFVINNTLYNHSSYGVSLIVPPNYYHNNITNNTLMQIDDSSIRATATPTDIVNLTVERNILFNSSSNNNVIRVEGSNSSIRFNTIYNFSDTAINNGYFNFANISNNTIFNGSAIGITISSGANNTNVYGNILYGIQSNGILYDTPNNAIINNRIENLSATGIIAYAPRGTNGTISGNTISGVQTGVVVIVSNNTVNSNTIYNAQTGISVNVSNNNVSGNTVYTVSLYGIIIPIGNNNTVISNTIYDSTTGIYSANGSNNTVNSNIISNSTANGIWINGTGHTVKSNTIINASNTGVFLNGTDSTAFGNTIYNASIGIQTGGTRHIVDSNTIYNVSTGINLYGTEHLIRSNHLDNTSGNDNPYAIEIADIPDQLNNITNNTIRGWNVGIDINAPNINITGNTIHSSSDIAILVSEENITIASNTIYNSTNVGIYLLGINGFGLTPATNTKITGNTIFNHTTSGSSVITDIGSPLTSSSAIDMETANAFNNISSNTIYGNVYGIVLNTVNNTVYESNRIENNTQYGIFINNSYFNNLSSNAILHNTLAGAFILNSGQTRLTNDHLYNNTNDLVVNSTGTTFVLNLSHVVFDNPYGNYQNYTNISLNDSVSANSAYTLTWNALPATAPTNFVTFANKYLNITNRSGTVSLDLILFHWGQEELGSQNESRFALYLYNGSWNAMNSSSDTTNNILSFTSLTSFGTWAILENTTSVIVACGTISSSGTHTLGADLFTTGNCTIINASDVTYSCAGHTITGDRNSLDAGIFITSAENVTVRDCFIQSFGYGIWLNSVNSSFFLNNTIYNISAKGIDFGSSNFDNNFTNNTLMGNDGDFDIYGIPSSDIVNTTIERNIIFNSTSGNVIRFAGSNSSIRFNTIHDISNGIDIWQFNSMNVSGNTLFNIFNAPLTVNNGANNTIIQNNTIYNFTGIAGAIYLTNSRDGILLNNHIENSSTNPAIIVFGGATNYSINGNTILNVTTGVLVYEDNNSIGSNSFENNTYGIYLNNSNRTTLSGNTLFHNTQAGVYVLNADKTTLTNDHLYNNTNDLVVNSTGTTFVLNLSHVVFDNPYGNYQNYTNISLNDSVSANSAYTLTWNALPATTPTNFVTFANKYLNITNRTGTVSIDLILFHWGQEELGSQNESRFALYLYNGSWNAMNSSSDTTNNILSFTSLTSFGTWAILENTTLIAISISSCTNITSSGSYQLTGNLTGATIAAAPLAGNACIKVAVNNVLLDLNGFNISNNATTGTVYGILLNGSANNISIFNDASNLSTVSNYTYGIFLHYSENDSVRNLRIHNNTEGIYFNHTNRTNISSNTIRFNQEESIELRNANSNNFSSNTIHNSSIGIYVLDSSSNNRIFSNSLFNPQAGSKVSIYLSSILSVNYIYDNTIENSSAGIIINSSNNIQVNNNTITNGGNSNAITLTDANNTIVSNNTIQNISQNFIGLSGQTRNSTLFNNTLFSGAQTGILTAENSTENNISFNTVYNNLYGILILENASGNNVSNNVVYNNSNFGIGISFLNGYSPSSNRLFSNTVYDHTRGQQAGIFLGQVEHLNHIYDNLVIENNTYGILLNYSNLTNITHNTVRFNTFGIYLLNGTSTILHNNTVANSTQSGLVLNYSNGTITNNAFCNSTVYDLHNLSINIGLNSSASRNRCDSFQNWNEFSGRNACTFSCSDVWHRYAGDATGDIVIRASGETISAFRWTANTGLNIYVYDADSNIDFSSLQALGRNTSGLPSTGDFAELDDALGTSVYWDGVAYSFSEGGSTPQRVANLTVFGSTIANVSINTSYWNSSFTTGILWDTSDDGGNGEYDNVTKEDIVFVVQVNVSVTDVLGTYDYLVKIPAQLATYKSGTNQVTFNAELR